MSKNWLEIPAHLRRPESRHKNPDVAIKVRQALQNAKDNGYDMKDASPNEVATDLQLFDVDLECEEHQQVASAVNDIRMKG